LFQAGIIFFSGPIFRALHQEQAVIELAVQYVTIMLIGMYGKVQFETVRCYLQAQKIYWIHTRILAFVAILHFIGCYFFIVKMDGGLLGAAWATSAAYIVAFSILCIYITMKRYVLLHPNVWHRFNEDSFKGFGDYLQQGFPIAVLRTLDVLGFQIILFYISWIGQIELCTWVIVAACTSLTLQVPLGIGTAAYNLIHHALVASHQENAKKYANITIAGGVVMGIVVGACYLIFAEDIVEIFTKDQAIVDTFITVSPVIAISQVFDFTQIVQSGILYSMGFHKQPSIVMISIMLVLAAPLSYWLAFNLKWGFVGAYVGLLIGLVIISLYFTYLI